MKTLVSYAALVAAVLAQDIFEPTDFNVTEALLDNGVNVSAIPELAELAERSLRGGCSTAVGAWPRSAFEVPANRSQVQFAEAHLR